MSQVRINEALYEKLKDKADKEGRTVQGLVRIILDEALKVKGKK